MSKVGHEIAAETEPSGDIEKRGEISAEYIGRFGTGVTQMDVIKTQREFEEFGARGWCWGRSVLASGISLGRSTLGASFGNAKN